MMRYGLVYERSSRDSLMNFRPKQDARILNVPTIESSAIRFQTFDEKLYPDFYMYKYPKPGEMNSTVECRVFDIEARTTRTMAVPLDKDGYIPRIAFTDSPDELAVMTLNRDQNRFDMYFVNPRTTVAKLVLRDESKYYIDSDFLTSIVFANDRFTYISEKDGYSHIYLYG
jgi:dipeptidyl-peptidase-4